MKISTTGGPAWVATTRQRIINGPINIAAALFPDGNESSVRDSVMIQFDRHGWQGIALACLLVPATVQAELTVIFDSGHTQPIAPFLEVFASADQRPQQSPVIKRSQLGAAVPKVWLPIQSPGLTPGPVQARSHDRPYARPFFLIGSDANSRQWLQNHRDRLAEIGAVGMLVQADTEDDLRTIAILANGLSILPAAASELATALGITHYPVLITAHGIEQ
jgi:integrating conjugative element protein (TIGR03765 family)